MSHHPTVKSAAPTPSTPMLRLPAIAACIALFLSAPGASGAPGFEFGSSSNVLFKAELSLKETYDSNLNLQDIAGADANISAARAAGLHPVEAGQSSWVTSVLPKIGLDYRPASSLALSAAYAPDVNFYHSASSEDYTAHRATLNLSGKARQTAWELLNTAAYIDGSSEGPTFARPGEVPALGGIPVRDRREAFILRNTFRLTHSFGDWFVRPVASSYVHDFKTRQLSVPPALRSTYIYENYIDRRDINGGLDVGRRVLDGTFFVLGYRYGQQEQYLAPNGPGGALIDSPYDSAYHRVLAGIEGSPVNWLKLNVAAGPDFRQFSDRAERMFPGFDSDRVLCYLDASVTVIPSKSDAVTLRSTRFEMPAFSSFSVYEDIRNELVWRHKFNAQLAGTAGFTFYNGDWQRPVARNDWIYTPSVSLSCTFSTRFSGEIAYSYDWVDSLSSESAEPYTDGHEFTRHLATVGLRYAF